MLSMRHVLAGLVVGSVGVVAVPAPAAAHIHLTSPLSRTDLATGDQKDQHCGYAGYVRASHPERTTVLAPGATITVAWDETVDHPGFYRIAFQPSGEVFGLPPPGAGGGFPDTAQPGLDDSNGSIVLVDRIADGTSSMAVTLPDLECDDCTLQLIQVMTDKPPYTTTLDSNDIYFNCADLVLSATAPDAGPQPIRPDAGGAVAGDARPGDDAGRPTGGCMIGGGGGAGVGSLVGLLVLALGARRRRR